MPTERDRSAPAELGEELEALKLRSGRSYAALAHRTGLSRSSLHRYCQGLTVPGTFGTVEAVARACGADDQEVDRLYRAWRRSVSAAEPVAGEGQDAEEGTADPGGTATAVPTPTNPTAAPTPAPAPAAATPTTTADTAPTSARRALVEAEAPPSDSGTGTGTSTEGAPDPADGRDPAPGPPAAATDAPRSRSVRARSWLRGVTLLAVLAVVSYAVTVSYPYLDGAGPDPGTAVRPEAGGRSSGGQRLEGPEWTVKPRAVPREFFGLTLNTDTGRMPGFRTGSVRLWDSETRWGSIEPRRRDYDWSTTDRMVRSAQRKGLPVLFTLSGTPLWADPSHPRRSAYEDSLASPPEDLADWDHFVKEAAERYRGRVDSYELWDYPSHRLHYSGSLSTLSEMVERASRIIRRADPSALVACPSFGRLWTEEGRKRLRDFARTGGFGSCDAAALKLAPRKATGPPEEIIELARTVRDLLYEEGVADIPLWNTGTDRDIAVAAPLDARRARDYAVRFYLAGLYAHHSGVRRMYFYSWGSTGVPLVVQPVAGRPTEAGLRMERLYGRLAGARVSGCGRGDAMGLADGAYTCRFERHGARLDVFWTVRGRAGTVLAQDARLVRHLDGTVERARAGARLGFGEEPVLVEHREGGEG